MDQTFFNEHGVSRVFETQNLAVQAAKDAGIPMPWLCVDVVTVNGGLLAADTVRLRSLHFRAQCSRLWGDTPLVDLYPETLASSVPGLSSCRRVGDGSVGRTVIVRMSDDVHRKARTEFVEIIRRVCFPLRTYQTSRPNWRSNPRNPLYLSHRRALAKVVRETMASIREDLTTINQEYDRRRTRGLFHAIQRFEIHLGLLDVERLSDAFQAMDEVRSYQTFSRASCGHVAIDSDTNSTVDGEVCHECFEDYRWVPDDDQHHHIDNVYYWDSDNEYHLEEEPEEEDEDDEYEEPPPAYGPDTLMDYSTNVMRYLNKDPNVRTSTNGDFHMGVELETIYSGDLSVNAKVKSVRNELGGEYLVAKRDGSLSGSDGQGIEWVTQPTSLAKHIRVLGEWEYSRSGLTAWDPGCCGMHVHIDSRAFTAATLGKLIHLYNDRANAKWLRKIAGRHPDMDAQAQSYAARDVDASANTPAKALKGKDARRYTMINTCNMADGEAERLGLSDRATDRTGRSGGTVEIRLFRASMKRERLLAQLEFAHAGVVFCRDAGFSELNQAGFALWLTKKRAGQYPHLTKFLGLTPRHGAQRPQVTAPANDELTATV